MAAAYNPTPSDTFGPCATACEHKDCAETRKIAAEICGGCETPIGFGSSYYDEGASGFYHAACLEKIIANEQEARA